MTIPWATAFYVLKKLMPVVIDKAPELLKTLERRRTPPAHTDSATSEPPLVLLQERIDAQEHLIAAQTESIVQLQLTITSMKRSLRIAWLVLTATALVSTSLLIGLLFRS